MVVRLVTMTIDEEEMREIQRMGNKTGNIRIT
jgi:hypothetical protein